MLQPGRYLKPVMGGDTEGTGKAVVVEVMRFGDATWYRYGNESTLYDLSKHQLDEASLVPENRQSSDHEAYLLDVPWSDEVQTESHGSPGHQAEEDLLFPERLAMIKAIGDLEEQLIAYEAVRGVDQLLQPLHTTAETLKQLSKSYLEEQKP